MATYTDTFVGSATIIINGRTLSDFGFGTVAEITCPNQIAGMDIGKDFNTVFSLQPAGSQADLKIKIIKGSKDDVFLNSLYESFKDSFESSIAITGSFISRVGDGNGNVITTAWVLNGGIPTTHPADKYDVAGDREQALMGYSFSFARGIRTLS